MRQLTGSQLAEAIPADPEVGPAYRRLVTALSKRGVLPGAWRNPSTGLCDVRSIDFPARGEPTVHYLLADDRGHIKRDSNRQAVYASTVVPSFEVEIPEVLSALAVEW